MRTLKLSSSALDAQNYLSTVIDSIIAPGLRDLELSCENWEIDLQESRPIPLVDFFERSRCTNVQRLALRQLMITDAEIIAALQVLPNLLEIDIMDIRKFGSHDMNGPPVLTSTLFLGMTLLDDSRNDLPGVSQLAPNLRRMTLIGDIQDCDKLLDMVESRRGSLEYVRVYIRKNERKSEWIQSQSNERLSPAHEKRVACWKEQGLDVEFSVVFY